MTVAGTTGTGQFGEGATGHDVNVATHEAVHRNQTHVHLPVPGGTLDLTLPPADRLVFYGGLAAAAALGAISWPIAIVTGLGHALADDRNNRTLEALGEALETTS